MHTWLKVHFHLILIILNAEHSDHEVVLVPLLTGHWWGPGMALPFLRLKFLAFLKLKIKSFGRHINIHVQCLFSVRSS